MSVHEVEAEALLLSSQERAQLADVLIASLNEDLALEQAWAMEAERRYEEIRSGRVQPSKSWRSWTSYCAELQVH